VEREMINDVVMEMYIIGPVTRAVSMTSSRFDMDFIGKQGNIEVQVLASSDTCGWLEGWDIKYRKVKVYGSLGMAVNDLVIKAEKIKKSY
jgi:hypothetical protein